MSTIAVPFKPRARLLLQLGDQLIRNERIALFELVKNAYDADASIVKITMNHVEDTNKGEILIVDNGCGMDKKTIRNVWMQPGTDYRAKEVKQRRLTPKYNRLPMGEKGIGRFAVHKLGYVVEMVTRKIDCPEVLVKIDWQTFEKDEFLDSIKVQIIEREPQIFTNNTGTMLKISKLRVPWDRKGIRSAYRAITSIANPFELGMLSRQSHLLADEQIKYMLELKSKVKTLVDESLFKIRFSCPDKPEYLADLATPEEIKEQALWRAFCLIDNNQLKMYFKFQPLPWMQEKIHSRELVFADEILDIENTRRPVQLNLLNNKIGTFGIDLLVFDRDSSVLKFGKKQLVEFLDQNGGVRVYRDGIRVYDYGEQGNDWLDLDKRRVNYPTRRLSNSIVVGAVFIDREKSEDLIEKTNREGFIENDAYFLFRKAILFAIDRFENERQIDKQNIRKIFGPTKEKEPVNSAFNTLRERIKKKVIEESLQKELVREVDKAQAEYEEVRDILLKSSSAGLGLSIVIHEFEKILKELVRVTEKESSSDRILTLVKHLEKLTAGFTILISKSKLEKKDLVDIISQARFNSEYRFKAHNIQIINKFSETNIDTRALCYENHFLTAVMNLIDNSIWWLDCKYAENKGLKKICLQIQEYQNGIAIIVADNGPGFTIPLEYASEPFITRKPGGMGLGLYIVKQIMQAHQGRLFFPEKGEISLPEGFEGAVVGLWLRRDTI